MAGRRGTRWQVTVREEGMVDTAAFLGAYARALVAEAQAPSGRAGDSLGAGNMVLLAEYQTTQPQQGAA